MDWTRQDQARYHASRNRFDKHPEWQASMRSVGPNNPKIQERPVPGNVGSLPPREKPPAPTLTNHQHVPFEGKSAYRDRGCKTPEQFRNGKTLGTRQKPKTQIIGIAR